MKTNFAKKMKTVLTSWAVYTYDVFGNKKDGYEVNDRYSQGIIDLRLKIRRNNAGTSNQFESASITKYQLQKAFGVSCQLTVDGDDLQYYVHRQSDYYPIGELRCKSHDTLSPISE